MSDGIANSISITTIHLALQQLLATYQSEKAESQADDDAWLTEYWESAIQTIYDVAAALSLSLEGQNEQADEVDQEEHRLHRPGVYQAALPSDAACSFMKAGSPVQDKYSPKQFLEDPLVDRGNSLQAFAKRHARLFLHTNIWQRPPAWVGALQEDWQLQHWCAFALYRRLVRRYGVVCPLPDERQVIDPMWWEVSPIASAGVQETEREALARILYIAAFTQELGRYSLDYIAEHSGQWNSRIHELAEGSLPYTNPEMIQ